LPLCSANDFTKNYKSVLKAIFATLFSPIIR
jgi:hypothetical protein